MAGKPRAQCKIVSEAVWARCRADYLSGMTAPVVAERHGVGVGGLRGRIAREGWSKVAHAAANSASPKTELSADPPLTPEAIGRAGLARASAALAAGRAHEATAIVEALESVTQLAIAIENVDRMNLDEAVQRFPHLEGALWEYAAWLAERMLGDGQVPERYADRAQAWRAAHLDLDASCHDPSQAERRR